MFSKSFYFGTPFVSLLIDFQAFKNIDFISKEIYLTVKMNNTSTNSNLIALFIRQLKANEALSPSEIEISQNYYFILTINLLSVGFNFCKYRI